MTTTGTTEKAPASKSSATMMHKPTCVVDNTVVNAHTLKNMTDLGLSFFANLCGRNRGAFVLDPSDGHTWGCTEFPPDFAELAGVDTSVVFADANAIVETMQDRNVTRKETVALLDYFTKMVYHSTPNVEKDPYACNTAGLAKLQCDPVNSIPTIKAVATTGLFVPMDWATGGKPLTAAERESFYTLKDFKEMKAAGLNTVQIPFPLTAFSPDIVPKAEDAGMLTHLTKVLGMTIKADVSVILVLVGQDNDNAVTAAANYAAEHSDAIFAVTLPSQQSLVAARAAQADLKLFLPVNQGDIPYLDFGNDPNVFGALDLSHTGTVGDVASSTPLDDRMKLFYHESTACISRSPLEFAECWPRVPLFVSSGFDLAIDDCVNQNSTAPDISFVDYGQCERFEDTVGSGWWQRHRQSFAARQMFAYEQGMGWSFAAWKLFGTETTGEIDQFGKLLSFQDVMAAGLLPPLDEGHTEACLNPPASDFIMGDLTYAPTAAPVDCGYGWWNETIQDCSYWIPPPPTAAPTGCPEVPDCSAMMESSCSNCSSTMSIGIGVACGLVVGVVVGRLFRGGGRAGYTEVPSVEEGV